MGLRFLSIRHAAARGISLPTGAATNPERRAADAVRVAPRVPSWLGGARGIALSALCLLASGNALAQAGDAQRGSQLYRNVCGACHALDPLRDRPSQVIGVPDGVLGAIEAISPMRFLATQLSAQDIADVQAWLDSLEAGAIADTRALSGSWYDPASSGQGFNFSVLPGDGFAFLFYGHRDDGSNLILAGSRVQRPRYGESFSVPVVAVEGGRFGGFDPAQIRRPPWGRLDLRFISCTQAEAVLDGRDGRQVLQLQPLTPIEGLSCDQPAD